ncbi:MAG TPA: tRNA glutamyl-Q(34) synthetase GluQRS [Planctomycetota bacterium]|nr:tRNA glutamyl-Q(34) synthetase GluQRS [Planctomycetota bacterium]
MSLSPAQPAISPVPLVGRLAPSPTGALHLGNARSFLMAWLATRLAGGRLVLRIEDLDGPRIKPWAVDQAQADLEYLGLDWDQTAPRQTTRLARYREVIESLQHRSLVYPCICSRKEVEAAVSAPHAGEMSTPYPGTCRDRFPDGSAAETAMQGTGRSAAWRLRLPDNLAAVQFIDQFAGPQRFELAALTGDFVVAKSLTLPAYQLAVVVDDADQAVNHVLRGDDLLSSTALQMHLQRVLGLPTPAYLHLPLVVGADGRRLAKRHGDTRLSLYREQGVAGDRMIGWLAFQSGLIDRNEAMTPVALLKKVQPSISAGAGVHIDAVAAWIRKCVPAQPLVVTPETIAAGLGL